MGLTFMFSKRTLPSMALARAAPRDAVTRRLLIRAVPSVALLAVTGCGAGTGSAAEAGDDLRVVAAFYPFAYVAERVAGDDAAVENLTAPGVEPHDLELSPRQVAAISDSTVAVYERGFQPAVDEAVEQNSPGTVVEVTDVVPLLDTGEAQVTGDPHVWQDPTRLAALGEAIAAALAETDAENAAAYRERAGVLSRELWALDADFRQGLADCARRTFVTSHAAFGYLAQRYDLDMVSISGLSPESEPSPARLAEVQQIAAEEGVTTIFYETLVSPDVAEALAGDLGLQTAVLDPAEGLTDATTDEDYFSLMRANLAALRDANGCT